MREDQTESNEQPRRIAYLYPASPISPVLESSRLRGNDRLVLFCVAFAIATDRPTTVAEISRMARLSSRRTAAALRVAEAAGELKRTADAGYRLILPAIVAAAA